MTKKYKVYQWELFENYFKMPSSNEIDNCALLAILIVINSVMTVIEFHSEVGDNSLYFYLPMNKLKGSFISCKMV